MKAKIFILGLCALGLVLTACTEKEVAVVTPLDASDVEVSFSAALQSDVVTKSIEGESLPIGESGFFLSTLVTENNSNPLVSGIGTRATEVTGFDPEGVDGTYSTFAVYSYLHSGEWVSATDAVPFINGLTTVSNGDGSWGFENKVFWPVNAENMTFFSYAPATENVVSFTTGEVDECGAYIDYTDPAFDATTGVSVEGLASQYDLLVATTADVAKTNSAVPLNFKHAFTAVQFECGDMPACTVTKLEISDIKYSGVYDLTAGGWTLGEETTTYTLIDSAHPLVLYGENGVALEAGSAILAGDATLMFLPQELQDAKLAITFYYYGLTEDDAETYEVTLNAEWTAGVKVTYTLSADHDDILPYLTDESFKAYALANIDSSGDGYVSHAEAAAVTSIKCGYYPDDEESNYEASDFTGIEYFTGLTSFESNTAEVLDLSKNTELTTLYLGHRNVTSNPDAASPITTLDLSKNTKITTLQSYAFRACDKLTSIVLPSSATTIDNYCFSNCTALTTVDFASVTTINQYAFEYCSVLANVALPSTLTTIGTDAFQYCLALSFVDDQIPDTVTSISTGVFGYSGLVSVIWPAGVTEVPRTTFTNCTSLANVTLPSTVTSIAQNSFIYCSALATMTIYATTPPSLNAQAFNGAGNFVLYVPAESVDAYEGWSSHVTAINAISD